MDASDTFQGAVARNAYLKGVVETSDPGRLVLLLYDELVKQLRVARARGEATSGAPGSSDVWPAVAGHLSRCKEILAYLVQTVNPQTGEVSQNLLGLYFFCLREIAQTMMDKNIERVDNILPVVGSLRDGWAGLVARQGDS